MKEDIYIWGNVIWIKESFWWKITFLDSDNNIIIENISDIDILDEDYYIKNNDWERIKWKWLLKLYNNWKENIYSLDINKIIFLKWYDYINTAKLGFYKHIYNYILSDEDSYYLSDTNGNIISKRYDDIEACDSIINCILSVSLGGEFNFVNMKWEELSDIWLDDCEYFKNTEFTKVSKWESKNFLSKKWKFLSLDWFDEYIFDNEWYAIVEIDNNEVVVWYYWNFKYQCTFEDNKYFQDKKVFDDFENNKEFIAFFVYLDYYMSKTYEWPHWKMKDYTLWFKDVEKTLKIFIFMLDNYKSYKNKFSFFNGKEFKNKYHHNLVWRREAILSSAIYYFIESNSKLREKYNWNHYYNLCLTYMDSFFKDYVKEYMKQGATKSEALWTMYDVVYWKKIYLTYCEWQWTPFCTWWYLDCLKK